MKKLLQCLILTIAILTSFEVVRAEVVQTKDQSVPVSQLAAVNAAANTATAQELETLLQDYFKAEKPAASARFKVGLVREFVKIVVTIAACLAVINLTPDDSLLQNMLLGSSVLLFPTFAELFMREKDDALIALQKLQKYVNGLSTEQRKNLVPLFRGKYALDLQKKVMQEIDRMLFQAGGTMVQIVEMLVPLLGCLFLVGFWGVKHGDTEIVKCAREISRVNACDWADGATELGRNLHGGIAFNYVRGVAQQYNHRAGALTRQLKEQNEPEEKNAKNRLFFMGIPLLVYVVLWFFINFSADDFKNEKITVFTDDKEVLEKINKMGLFDSHNRQRMYAWLRILVALS